MSSNVNTETSVASPSGTVLPDRPIQSTKDASSLPDETVENSLPNHLHKQVGDLRDEASRRSDQAVLVQEFVEPMEEQDSPQLIVDELNWSAVSLPWRYGTDSLAVRGPHPSRNWLLLRTAPATKMVDLTARPSALPPMCSIHHRPLIPPGYLRQLKDFYRGLFLWYGPSIRRLTSAYIPLEKRRHSEIDVDEEIEDRDVLRHDGLVRRGLKFASAFRFSSLLLW
ncbi:hypothetical protein EV121DRAFT_274918 [Schizophyllum commune]